MVVVDELDECVQIGITELALELTPSMGFVFFESIQGIGKRITEPELAGGHGIRGGLCMNAERLYRVCLLQFVYGASGFLMDYRSTVPGNLSITVVN